ncbi:hypothetical protein ACQKTA_04235 [Enterococcus sp. 22-H-5-01]|uniref:hypothetical protein n=1 Tax=Enterococcus sp. 22-H-5-01 TaxID=3418555 RepID=UPI003D0368EB
MMCEYCEKGKKIKDMAQEDGFGFKDDDCANIKGNIFHVEAVTAAGEINADIDLDYRINCCPMCGVKLMKGKPISSED